MRPAAEVRARDLLADRAVQGLDAAQRCRLDALVAARPELDDDSFDLAAAAVDLAYTDASEPLPPRLRARVLETWLGSVGGGVE